MVTTKIAGHNAMTGRYTRKTVPLEISGTKRDRSNSIPLPEKPEEAFRGYEAHYQYVEPAYSSGQSSTSDQSSPEQTDATNSWMSLSHGWTTGNTTERSSIYTLGEDEFDRVASRRVRKLFDEIDQMLFEGKQGPQNLYGECQEWVSQFPHLRILGYQMVPPQDLGFQIVSQTPRPGSASNMLVDVTEQDHMHDLSITGHHVEAVQPPSDTLTLLTEIREDYYPYEKEEVFAQDGYVEDIIAVDYKSSSDGGSKHVGMIRQRKISGLPPVTPHACVKDNISGAAFDFVWSEVVSMMRVVLSQFSQHLAMLAEIEFEDDVHGLPCMLPDSFGFGGNDLMPVSREASLLGGAGRPDRAGRLQGLSQIQEKRELDGLLTISSKALMSREKSNLTESQLVEVGQLSALPGYAIHRPGSSFTRLSNRPLSVKMTDQVGRLTSARLRAAGRGRLAPLERAKTPNVDDEKSQMKPNEVLRGRGLSTMADRLTSPPSPFQRNGALPPISLDREDSASLPRRKAHFSMRASSAIHDKEVRVAFRDREKISTPLEARPSTTHALYRSETPFGNTKRSSTPLGMSSMRFAQGIGAVSGLATSPQTQNILQLNVTGNSINPQADNEISDSVELHETSDHLDELISPQWGTSSQLPRSRTKSQYSMGSVR